MFLSLARSSWTAPVTGIVALVFFLFCSAAMLWRYYHDDVVFAVREAGLLDKRWSQKVKSWDEIKEVVLKRREHEFRIEVIMWPDRQGNSGPTHQVDLTQFDVDIADVLAEIERYKPVRHELG